MSFPWAQYRCFNNDTLLCSEYVRLWGSCSINAIIGSCHGVRQKLKLRDSVCTSGSATRWAGSAFNHQFKMKKLQVTQLLLGLVTRLARVEKEVTFYQMIQLQICTNTITKTQKFCMLFIFWYPVARWMSGKGKKREMVVGGIVGGGRAIVNTRVGGTARVNIVRTRGSCWGDGRYWWGNWRRHAGSS